jgi:hypothetical protein
MALSPKLLLALLAGFVSLFTGCCGVQCVSPCGRGMVGNCGSVGCAAACDTGCDTGACGASACGSAACDNACGCTNLLNGEIARRVKTAMIGGCCAGCGEVYYDEQINEPPTCDPCGCNGKFTGQSIGPCQPLIQRIRALMGTPYIANCGCDSCGPSCGQDAYATQHNGSGYCPSCHDGVAGVPQYNSSGSGHATTVPTPAANRPVFNGSSTPQEAGPKLEPTPDPLSSSRPSKSSVTNNRRVSMR